MLISDRFKFVFVHIGKTGGTAVQRALQPHSAQGPWNKSTEYKHYSAKQIKKEFFSGGQRKWWRYYSFCVVRNTWERIHSNYYYTKRIYNRTNQNLNRVPDWKKKWVEHNNATALACPDFKSFVVLQCNNTMPAQTKYYKNAAGKGMVKKVIRYDRLSLEWEPLIERLGVPPVRLRPVNVSRDRPHYRTEYSPALADLVRQAFAEEIEEHGFVF